MVLRGALWCFRAASTGYDGYDSWCFVVLRGAFVLPQKTTMDMIKRGVDHHE